MPHLVFVLALLLLAACDAPTALRKAPEADELTLFMILSPDSSSQPVLVAPVTTEGVIDRLAGDIYRGDDRVASAVGLAEWDSNELHPCIRRYGTMVGIGGQPRCLAFDFIPQFGATYQLVFSAKNRPTVTATARVPGDFELLETSAQGDPPGTEGLEVRWTSSEGAHRYLVGLRAETPPWDCGPACTAAPDRQGWFMVTTDTVLNTVVSGTGAEEIENGKGPWYVDVYAVDQALYEYLATGTSGDLFPVPPVQNVDGGYGAVGAWVRRSIQVRP